MSGSQRIVIENSWKSWGSVTGLAGSDAAAAQVAVLKAGSTIKRRLGLRGEPFKFRAAASGIEFQASGLAGTLSLREVSIEIVPKFVFDFEQFPRWTTSTLFLLETLAGKHVIPLLAERQQWKSHRVLDMIAHAFADAAERGLRDQLIQTYQHTEESSVVLRGRLNVGRQVRNMFHAPHMLECDIDQLDVENPFNDVLKWAATILSNSVGDAKLKMRLQAAAKAIPGHLERSIAHRHYRLLPPPQFQAWSDALELSRLLASGMTLSGNGGNSSGYSILFNMERAFERFVEVALARALTSIGDDELTGTRQDRINYAQPESPPNKPLFCQPDNIVRRLGLPIMVVDAKYKLLDRNLREATEAGGAPISQDVYELTAGMFANNCKAGLLVYPAGSLDADSEKVRVWNLNIFGTEVRIGALPIDLLSLQSRSELSALVRDVGDQIFGFLRES